MSWLSDFLGQDAAKESQRYQKKAVGQAEQEYGDLAPYRTLGSRMLQNPQSYDYTDQFTAKYDPLFGQAQTSAANALKSLDSSPDYYAQAAQKLQDLGRIEDTGLQDSYRAIGQKNAALGRIGSSQVNTENSKALADSLMRRDAAKREFLSDALNQDYANRFKKIGVASDLAGQQFGFGQAGVQNRAAQLAAERAARGEDFGRGMSLLGFGFGRSPEAAYGRAADAYGREAAGKAAAAGQLLGAGMQAAVGMSGGGGAKPPAQASMASLGWGGGFE